MRRMLDYQTYLAALQRWFHGNQIPGELYRPEPIVHSLGARGGGRRDANGNRIEAKGRVIGRDAAFYPIGNPVNQYTGKPVGTWLK